jgi:hypothetical protein
MQVLALGPGTAGLAANLVVPEVAALQLAASTVSETEPTRGFWFNGVELVNSKSIKLSLQCDGEE